MGKYSFSSPDLDNRHRKSLELAKRMLRRVAVGDGGGVILDALSSCVPAAAGLLAVVRSGAPQVVANQAIRLPEPLLQGWMSTRPEHLDQALQPVVSSNPGDFWRDADAVTGSRPELAELLRDGAAA